MFQHLTAIVLIVAVPVFGQYASDAVRPFYGGGGPGGSRAEGLAQAFTAIADDGSALYYNPAGLAHQTSAEFNFGLNRIVAGTGGSADNTFSISATRLGNLFVVLPAKGTKWTVALGYHSVRAFERARRLSVTASDGSILTETVIEEGHLSAGVVGAGYQVSPKLSVGATFNILYGSNTYDDSDDEVLDEILVSSTFLHIEPSYLGVGISLGILAAPTSFWRLGFLIQSPQSIAVTETSYDDEYPEEVSREYTTRQGFSLRAGTAFSMGPLLLSADLFWEDFSQIRFESNIVEEFIDQDSIAYDLPIDLSVNNDLRTNYSSAPGAAVGGELLLPAINVKLRGGYRFRPAIKRGTFEESARQTVTAGASFLLTSGLKLDVTYSHSYWERELAETSVFWQSGIDPLRSTAGTLAANLVMRL